MERHQHGTVGAPRRQAELSGGTARGCGSRGATDFWHAEGAQLLAKRLTSCHIASVTVGKVANIQAYWH
jgi:hypothetical protein